MPIRLSIIVVNWNGGNAVVANVRSLAGRARTRGDTEIIVVDNASTDRSREELSALADDAVVRVLPQPGNRGFGPACNVGASDARSSLLLFLNPDVRPRVSEDPLGALIDAADAQAEYAGFCPLLLDDDTGAMARQQRFQFRHLWTPSAIVRDALLVNQLRPNNRALQRDRYLTVDRSRPFEVQQPAAAALMLRRTVFEAVGGFDERYLPAWWEDADLAERLHRGGHRLITVPDARFVHQGGSSLERRDAALALE